MLGRVDERPLDGERALIVLFLLAVLFLGAFFCCLFRLLFFRFFGQLFQSFCLFSCRIFLLLFLCFFLGYSLFLETSSLRSSACFRCFSSFLLSIRFDFRRDNGTRSSLPPDMIPEMEAMIFLGAWLLKKIAIIEVFVDICQRIRCECILPPRGSFLSWNFERYRCRHRLVAQRLRWLFLDRRATTLVVKPALGSAHSECLLHIFSSFRYSFCSAVFVSFMKTRIASSLLKTWHVLSQCCCHLRRDRKDCFAYCTAFHQSGTNVIVFRCNLHFIGLSLIMS